MRYQCGCEASGDNVANYCPIHGDAEIKCHESCIPCNCRKHGACDGNETGKCPEWLCPFNAES